MTFYKIASILPLCVLMACENGPNFAELCEQNPEICLEFQEDTWCKRERIAVGFANLADKVEANDSNKFQQLIAYEGYAKCMAHASKIEHIKLKIKKTIRINNVMKAQEKIKEISLATRNSEHPDLLFFHWSRYLNEHSLAKFVALEGNELLEKPNRQVNLASFYAKRDPNKTLKLLYHALELYESDATLDTEIFKSIASIFADKKEHKQAYIWSKILHLYNPEDTNITDKSLDSYAKGSGLNHEFLDKVANSTLNKIIAGKFKSPHS
ncbi:DUF2989 domain-containing protein [Colwellia sp. M166]|uniref:DUF2989 domain-containing protein n=1 Tax=Colwellia sp. M166 TaxID=2583805 RepID=UPI00211F0EE3|nr:DUF2989 domain-containing protein [Colwellia sp. M166]UUO22280.1 DUF2989 domain-containing protein [Colwellia sp. M166]|tara:strand:- start:44320 stop:45123 length:804 start_codon:yes stop_codon:yes gene_type:complete